MGSALLFAGTQRAGTAGGSAGRGLGAAAFMLGGVAQGVDLALLLVKRRVLRLYVLELYLTRHYDCL